MIIPLAVHRAGFLKTREKLLLNEVVESERQFSLLTRRDIEAVIQRSLRRAAWAPEQLLLEAEKDAGYCAAAGIDLIHYWSPSYPVLLRELYNGPFLLFVRGGLPENDIAHLGIVGTRKPTGSGKKAAFQLGFRAAELNLPVVSGLARGIDGAAHAGCLKAGGRTVAVLGSGIDRIYPEEHRRLAAGILEAKGALVSEYPPGTPPLRYHFPERNRIISGMCRGTVIVQCPEKSGAMITADYALEQGRDLYVHIEGMNGWVGAGTRRLSEEGATAIEGIEEIMKDWNRKVKNNNASQQYGNPAVSCSGEAGTMMARLVEMELMGSVARRYGGYCRSGSNG